MEPGRPRGSAESCGLREAVGRLGPRLNLTGLRGAEAILAGLVVDSVLLGRALPGFMSLVDIGSGGGLPGIPLALLFPERRFLLIEPRERRHHFLRHAIRVLRADNIRTLRARADEQTPELHDIAVAQAVGPPDRVIPMLLRWVRPGGWIAIPTFAEGCSIATLPAGLDSRLEPYGTGRPGSTRSVGSCSGLVATRGSGGFTGERWTGVIAAAHEWTAYAKTAVIRRVVIRNVVVHVVARRIVRGVRQASDSRRVSMSDGRSLVACGTCFAPPHRSAMKPR